MSAATLAACAAAGADERGFHEASISGITRRAGTALAGLNASQALTLDPRVPWIIAIILPVAAAAAIEPGQCIAQLDPHDIFGLLVAQLPLDPQADRLKRSTGRTPTGTAGKTLPGAGRQVPS